MLVGRRPYHNLLCKAFEHYIWVQFYKKEDAKDLFTTIVEMAFVINIEGDEYFEKLKCLAAKIKICSPDIPTIEEKISQLEFQIETGTLSTNKLDIQID